MARRGAWVESRPAPVAHQPAVEHQPVAPALSLSLNAHFLRATHSAGPGTVLDQAARGDGHGPCGDGGAACGSAGRDDGTRARRAAGGLLHKQLEGGARDEGGPPPYPRPVPRRRGLLPSPACGDVCKCCGGLSPTSARFSPRCQIKITPLSEALRGGGSWSRAARGYMATVQCRSDAHPPQVVYLLAMRVRVPLL